MSPDTSTLAAAACATSYAYEVTEALDQVALVGAASAMAAGLGGADVAVAFAISAGVLAGFAAASGRLAVRDLVRSIPVAGLAVIGFAADRQRSHQGRD